jgi:hypothetical protein
MANNNAGLFTQPGFQAFTFYLAEPVRMNAVLEALAEYLVLYWVVEAFKDRHGHLPGFQIID